MAGWVGRSPARRRPCRGTDGYPGPHPTPTGKTPTPPPGTRRIPRQERRTPRAPAGPARTGAGPGPSEAGRAQARFDIGQALFELEHAHRALVLVAGPLQHVDHLDQPFQREFFLAADRVGDVFLEDVGHGMASSSATVVAMAIENTGRLPDSSTSHCVALYPLGRRTGRSAPTEPTQRSLPSP